MTPFAVARATAEFSAACGASAPEDYFAIEVADADTGHGIGQQTTPTQFLSHSGPAVTTQLGESPRTGDLQPELMGADFGRTGRAVSLRPLRKSLADGRLVIANHPQGQLSSRR